MWFFRNKEKNKNLMPEELQQLIAEKTRQAKVNPEDIASEICEKLIKKLNRGKFKIDQNGNIVIHLWFGHDVLYPVGYIDNELKTYGYQLRNTDFPMRGGVDYKIKPIR